MKTSLKIFVLSILLLIPFSFSRVLYAQEEITNDDIVQLDQKEEEREQDFLNQLLLNIPLITDNPSHIVTFVDPSEKKEGVQLEIDGKGYEQILTPYTLPALSIGKHVLNFKFVDKYGSTQILEKELIVIPRPPIINTPTLSDEVLTLSGIGLANSELVLILSSSKNITSLETDITSEGTWEIQIAMTELTDGVYTFTAYTRRYGYAGNLAESVTFQIGDGDGLYLNDQIEKDMYFRFKDISFSNITNIVAENFDLVILVIVTFTLGFVASWLLNLIFRDNTDKKNLKMLEKKINGKDKEEKKEEMTLKEKLSKKEEVQEEEVIPKKEKKEKKKHKEEEKIVTKIDFLKDYKKFDPDDEKGAEKENIKVTLTSKD